MNEAQFTETVIQIAKLYGWHVAHFRPAQDRGGRWRTAMSGDPGFPDLVMAREGEVIFAELKSLDGRLAPAQQGWLDALNTSIPVADRTTVVWRPSDLDYIKTRLRSNA